MEGYEERSTMAPTEPMNIVKRVLAEKNHMSDVIIEKAHRTGKKSAPGHGKLYSK